MKTEPTTATLAVKVSADFARTYREFCEAHSLQLGRFTEQALAEVMEDHYFGLKAQRVLSLTSGQTIPHEKAFRRRSPRRR
ncbi:MAG TPA: hypothetical protein VGQ83_08605 [Polyangia bacterium]|jgi:hypothetical protein